jgi:hypothetical protein
MMAELEPPNNGRIASSQQQQNQPNGDRSDAASTDSSSELRTLVRPVELRQGDVIS